MVVFLGEREQNDARGWVVVQQNDLIPLFYPLLPIYLLFTSYPYPLSCSPILCPLSLLSHAPLALDSHKCEGVHITNLEIPLGMDDRFSQEVLGAGALKNPVGKKLPPSNMTRR